jgi:hypothetical protein
MDAETIKYIVTAICGTITTIGLAYVGARWHSTIAQDKQTKIDRAEEAKNVKDVIDKS